ncbi:gamma carbonic anhydrase family protein [Tengunoibacter tsumagoiensis]|uniref:Gamma carbonic anhydrase family protein n=1 Tax=Tengunoibacter tsumagoiensis TaxID=2014871 RepID=A0A402A5B2_9CHLR|nr:gamma carbonic anhydrase family protein [Tengunoibacter tsumagoiensis]GCE14334.1 gamma carbonic anhydrase family protein [Tengunoibacter tsumagoiensis]
MPIFPYKGIWPKIAENVFIAPGAMVIGNVTLHEGVSVWYNAVLRADSAPIVVGQKSNIQDNCTLHVDDDAPLTIGEWCTIGHNAVVHGATLGDYVLIGMNATVLSHAQIGSYAVIGAGALVAEHKQVPECMLALGSPARPLRHLSEDDRNNLAKSAMHYFELASEYRFQTEQE